ncbi:DUF58 domain-containing protein [Fulvivirga sedimenti]|uniref:DUF58 domain-containing protein n=1 Tax=Fulvivirga sedimenti TaxID=2879465 RepID=A0A9X1HRY4_9BACT|nr:DUF58 domain-containing protein [Fulvivirga sedimenti]MCA6074943.1 DUF58 domain-containing protein [Fulvivirga sedimenti]MCA6076120.1 DUF58 domain-containing protein [Fulvivirga sedimenti]MCA6077248.1 DUF58 domain-containing protein [Fulvivirga sedimenti]
MKLPLDRIKELGNIDFLARQLVDGFITGLHKSPYHGFSVEFAEHKLYNTGESTRHIDWKVYAKTERLYTKRYEEETNLRCQLVIDVSSSMYYPSETRGKLMYSLLSAAALAFMLQRQRDAVGLATFSDKIEYTSQIRSTSTHLNKLFIQLQQLADDEKVESKTSVATILHEIAEMNPRRSLIILFSDMFDSQDTNEIFKGLQHLKHNQHEVLLFHITDKKTEFEFAFDDRPYEFIDLESGEKMKLNPADVKTAYREQIDRFYKELKLKCGQLKIDFIPMDIHNDFNDVLYSYLVKRSKMR